MNPSPSSAVSSSDPYHSSDPAEREAQSHTSFNLPLSRESFRPASEGRESSSEDPTHLQPSGENVQQGSHIVGNGSICIPSESGTHLVSMANGESQRNHKRKWEDDVETSAQEDPSTVERVENIPHPCGNVGHGSRRYTSTEESGEFLSDWSSKKRSKLNEDLGEPILRTEDSFHSPLLPAELWQHVFCFVPPVFLGRLLRVNHAFKAYLTPDNANEQDPEPILHSVAQPLNPQAIWAASRKRFCPGLPKPIRGIHELDMWRLLRGRNCQVCHETKEPNLTPNPDNPWESGPGDKGVRVVWPFTLRCCGKCIPKISEKVHFSFLDGVNPN